MNTQITKNTSWIMSILLLFSFFIFQSLFSQGSPTQPKISKESNFVQGEVLVKFKPKTPKRFILALKESLKVSSESYTKSIDLYHWKGDFDTKKAIQKLQKSPHVLYAEPNYIAQIQKDKRDK